MSALVAGTKPAKDWQGCSPHPPHPLSSATVPRGYQPADQTTDGVSQTALTYSLS